MSNGYQSQQTPNDDGSQFNAHRFLIKALINRMATFAEVQVVAVASGGLGAAGFVDVQPLVNQVDGGGTAVPHAVIHNLPIFRLQGGGNAVVIDPQVGDIGLAAFCMNDISAVKAARARANPGSLRRYDMADGIYFGGNLNQGPTQYVEFIPGGGINLLDLFGNLIQMEAAGVNINGVLIDRSGNITAPGEITRGAGTADSVTVGHHTHTQPADSHGDSEMPTLAPTPGT